MRALLMAIFAFDFPGHGDTRHARAGLPGANTSTKTTTKTV